MAKEEESTDVESRSFVSAPVPVASSAMACGWPPGTGYPYGPIGRGPGSFTENGVYEVDCPPHLVGRVIGRGGETIKRITQRFNVRCNIKQDVPEGAPRIVQISGAPPEVLEACGLHVKEVMDNGPPEHHTFRGERSAQGGPVLPVPTSPWINPAPWVPPYVAYPASYGSSPILGYYPHPYGPYYDPSIVYAAAPVVPSMMQGIPSPAMVAEPGSLDASIDREREE